MELVGVVDTEGVEFVGGLVVGLDFVFEVVGTEGVDFALVVAGAGIEGVNFVEGVGIVGMAVVVVDIELVGVVGIDVEGVVVEEVLKDLLGLRVGANH